MQNLPPWQGAPEWSFQITRITSCSGARASARYHIGLNTGDWLVQDRSLLGLVNDWREYLTEGDEHNNTNYELHLRTGRPLGSADFVEKLER